MSSALCPKCGGGRTRERSLSRWRRDKYTEVEHCWRSSCGYTAEIISGAPAASFQAPFAPECFITQKQPLSQYMVELLRGKYRIQQESAEMYGLGECVHFGKLMLVMPLLDAAGAWRGQVLRTVGDKHKVVIAQPLSKETICAGWYRNYQRGIQCLLSQRIIVVEDQLSALRLAQIGMSAYALIGVSMVLDKFQELTRHVDPSQVVVALDADATRRGLRCASRYGFRCLRLIRDFKDCTNEQILEHIAR